MATLIGNGSHAKDIRQFLPGNTLQVDHHKDWDPDIHGRAVIIGVNNPQQRYDISYDMGVNDLDWIHPCTYFGPRCRIGMGTHVNYGVTMTRTTIGHHCTISPGVTICGDVTIGDRVLIGAGATICDRVTIGNDVTIGAGAVILPETVVPDGETWVGVPARRV